MSKATSKPNRLENEAIAKARYIKGSERKLNLVAQLIRGKTAQQALVELEFCAKRMSNEVRKVLEAAIANAENNHSLDVDRLYVKEAVVGRTLTMKRFHARGRGRSAGVEKPFSNITIRVSEKSGDAEEKKVKAKAKAAKKEPAKAKPSKKSEAKTEAAKAE